MVGREIAWSSDRDLVLAKSKSRLGELRLAKRRELVDSYTPKITTGQQIAKALAEAAPKAPPS